jgi:hypothetical protein
LSCASSTCVIASRACPGRESENSRLRRGRVGRAFEVPHLRGGELIVEDRPARSDVPAKLGNLLDLAPSYVRGRIGRLPLLEGTCDDGSPRRVDEALQFVEVVLRCRAVRLPAEDADENRPAARRLLSLGGGTCRRRRFHVKGC